MCGSGGAPQLDERRWTIFVCPECASRQMWLYEEGERPAMQCAPLDPDGQLEHQPTECIAVGVVPLAASPGAGELDLKEFADNFKARLKRTEGPGLHPDSYTVEEVVDVLRNVARDHGIEVEK